MALLDDQTEARALPEAAPREVLRESARRTLAMRIAHRNRLRAERLARLRRDDTAGLGAAAGAGQPAEPASDTPGPAGSGDDDGAALEEFLRALTGAAGLPAPLRATEPSPAAVLQFQRPAARAAEDAAQTKTPAEDAAQTKTPAEDAAQTKTPAEDAARSGDSAENPAAVFPDAAAAKPGHGPGPGDLGHLPGMGPGLAWACARAGLPDCAAIAGLAPEALAARLGPLGRLIPAETWIAAARAARAAATPAAGASATG